MLYNNILFQCQGQTIAPPIKILADLDETFQPGMCYVILSRIVKLDQLYLKPFNEKKIYCHEAAKAEAMRIRKNSITKVKTKWDLEGSTKISLINARSLMKHSEDLENDFYLNKSDIICVTETWLTEDLVGKFQNFPNQYYLNRRSEGVAIISRYKPNNVEMFHNELSSTIVASYDKFTLINVYRFAKGGQVAKFTNQFISDVTGYIDGTVVVCGDLNLDLIDDGNNIFTKTLSNLGFEYLPTGPTHILGGQIDHVYFRCQDETISVELNKLFSTYWSDHDAVTFFIN